MSLSDPRKTPDSTDPLTIIQSGCKANDIPTVAHGLELAASHGNKDAYLLETALHSAVFAGQTAVVRYLLEQEHLSVEDLNPMWVFPKASPELLQLLVDHRFDINSPEPRPFFGRGGYLLQRVCHDEVLVRWCLEHGAKVDGMFVDPFTSPPLLESVASLGTVSTFALLLAKGAKLEGRILHVAARNVGSPPDVGPEYFRNRMAMVRYLVDDVGLDVNALDSEESMAGDFWGTPICYAARNPFDCAEVVSFLLERGADPYIKERMFGRFDAFNIPKDTKNPSITNVLEEWKLKHGKEKV